MKTNSILQSALLVAGFSAFALIGGAQAQVVVNVDLNSPTGTSGTYSGQGAYSDPGNNLWNGLTLSTGPSAQSWTSLQTSTGGSTSVGLTIAPTGGQILNYYDTLGDGQNALVAPALLNDFVYSSGNADIDFSFSGLNASHTYALYIYTQNGGYDTEYGNITVGSTTEFAFNSGNGGGTKDTSLVLGANYDEFTNLTGSTSISGTLDGALSGGNYGINGFQLVDTTPAEAPEPSTYALMGLGALALVVISRRRRTV